MSEYVLKGIIPTESEARGLSYGNGMYFSSHTNVFRVENNRSKLFSSCEGTIRMFSVCNNNIYMCTEDRVYMNHFELCIGSLKRTATAIDSTQDVIAIGVNNALEIWHVPKEYAFTLFRQHSKNVGHYKAIICIKIVDSQTVITASEDCTVRVFDILERRSRIIASLSDVPVGLHYNEGQVVVTCRNGSVVFLSLESSEFHNVRFEATLMSSSSHGSMLVLALTGMEIASQKNDEALLPSTAHEAPRKKELSTRCMIVLLKEREEVYRAEMDCSVDEVSLNGYRVAIRSKGFAGIFDTQTGAFLFSMDLPKCLNMSEGQGLLSVGCADRSVRIYRDTSCISRLFDQKARGDIAGTHISSNTCVAVYKTGYVSAFNICDGNCYRSFSIDAFGNDTFSLYSGSCLSEDGCFLFVSNKTEIHVIEMQRSRLIDTMRTKSPIISMVYYKDHLYTLELDKTLARHSVFSGASDSIALESMGTNLSVRNDIVAVSTINEVVLYSLGLEFRSSFRVLLEGRNRSEMYSKAKPVEQLDLGLRHVFCGGQANTIKVVEYSRDTSRSLMSNNLVQEIKVSRNKDWENYKAKLYREKTTEYDKRKVIETLKIAASERRFFVLSREGVSMFEVDDRMFNPIEFDVKATPEFVLENTRLHNYQKALISALQLGSAELAKHVIDNSTDIDFMVQYIPRQYMHALLEVALAYLKQDFGNIRLIELINRVVFHHRVSLPGLLDILSEGTRTSYSLLKKNHYLMQSMIQRLNKENSPPVERPFKISG